MKERATLKQILLRWQQPILQGCSRKEFCYALLPDAYNVRFCGDPGTTSYLDNISDSVLRKFVTGNYAQKGSERYAHAQFTNDIIEKLRSNSIFYYKDDRPCTSYRQNMLHKIQLLVRGTLPPMTAQHPLFTQLGLVDEAQAKATPYWSYLETLQRSMDRLLENGSEGALSYAVFLLVLTAILREQGMAQLFELYEPAAISRLLELENCQSDGVLTNQVSFSDPNYMYSYHLYLYTEASDCLYKAGSLSLSRPSETRTQAALNIIFEDFQGIDRESQYTGSTMFSPRDDMVYALMTSPEGQMAFLCFKHEKFKFQKMYFRSALLIRPAPRTHVPQVQKVILTSKNLSGEELSYVEGALKFNDAQIFLTEQQLEDFRHTFAECSWMKEFDRTLLPFIKQHEKTYYSFSGDELLSCSLSSLSEQERLQIMLLLKKSADSTSPELYNLIRCIDPLNIHRLFREDMM